MIVLKKILGAQNKKNSVVSEEAWLISIYNTNVSAGGFIWVLCLRGCEYTKYRVTCVKLKISCDRGHLSDPSIGHKSEVLFFGIFNIQSNLCCNTSE